MSAPAKPQPPSPPAAPLDRDLLAARDVLTKVLRARSKAFAEVQAARRNRAPDSDGKQNRLDVLTGYSDTLRKLIDRVERNSVIDRQLLELVESYDSEDAEKLEDATQRLVNLGRAQRARSGRRMYRAPQVSSAPAATTPDPKTETGSFARPAPASSAAVRDALASPPPGVAPSPGAGDATTSTGDAPGEGPPPPDEDPLAVAEAEAREDELPAGIADNGEAVPNG